MPRRIRNTWALAALESTYGVAPTFVATDAILMNRFEPNFPREGVPRDLILSHMGASEELVGARRAEIRIVCELAGSGTAGTPPAWGRLMRACGFAETVTAGQRVEYTPVSTGLESLAINFNNDGVKYQARGMMGSVKIMLNINEAPKLEFNFKGFDAFGSTGGIVSPSFTNWKRPLVVNDTNSPGFKIGATYSAGAFSGGASLISQGMTFDIGNSVQHMQLLNGEGIDITDRDATGTGIVELTAADEVQWRTDMNANTLTSMAFQHGTTAGNKVGIFLPNMQRLNNQIVNYQGRAMTGFDMRALPLAGNDEVRIIVS